MEHNGYVSNYVVQFFYEMILQCISSNIREKRCMLTYSNTELLIAFVLYNLLVVQPIRQKLKIRRKSCATKSNILTGWENTNVTIEDLMIHVPSFKSKHTV